MNKMKAPDLSAEHDPIKRLMLLESFLATHMAGPMFASFQNGASPHEIATAMQMLAFSSAHGVCCEYHAAEIHGEAMEAYHRINYPTEVA